jgi:signal transduction histidine kinase
VSSRLPLRVRVRSVEIEQVVLNLLQNAVDAIVGSANGRRELRLQASLEPGGYVKVAVTDTGSGVSEALADRIFDPFVTTKPGGLGMGLAICRSIVIDHGGRLWLERGPAGPATTMCFTLPLSGPSRRGSRRRPREIAR